MAPKFGTSGLRGLVSDLTSDLVAEYVRAFVIACDVGETVCIGRDLRASSPEIADAAAETARRAGLSVVDCGAVPTPALALAAKEAGGGAIMVTGSHIPADRNGLKFYSRAGEITKVDEAEIQAARGRAAPDVPPGSFRRDDAAGERYVARYVSFCGGDALRGRRIGLYAHSAVGRDHLAQILRGLGAEVVPFGRSETFVPVDTEAVEPETRRDLAARAADEGFDAIVSTDGDSDRPLLTDETGRVIPGDVLGQITARALGAEIVVTPISSNSGVMAKGFRSVIRTRIGSPYVIAGMTESGGRVVGYEANGGFLLGYDAEGPSGALPALLTRDCVLPILMPLIAAGDEPLSHRVAQEPPVVTLAGRLQDVPDARMREVVGYLSDDPAARGDLVAACGGAEADLDLTDGVRIGLADGRILHVRPSGNAPELRLYVEAADEESAERLRQAGLDYLKARIG